MTMGNGFGPLVQSGGRQTNIRRDLVIEGKKGNYYGFEAFQWDL
jgi:hypothetical protein